MIKDPYRYPSEFYVLPGGTKRLPSITEMPDVQFLPMPSPARSLCRDIYGDLPFGLFVLPKISIRGEAGFLYTKDGLPLREQNAGFLRKKKLLRHRFENQSVSEGKLKEAAQVLSLLSHCHDYFWHWMTDCLPKVFLAEQAGYGGQYLLPAQHLVPWARESMNIFGISDSRILVHDDGEFFAEELFLPSYFCGYNAHCNIPFMKEFRACVQDKLSLHEQAPTERILVGRSKTAKFRRILNHDDLEEMLATYGFRTMYFENVSLSEQIKLAWNTEILLGSHGSGLTHALFMQEGGAVIELFPFHRVQSCDCYEKISLIPRHRYYALESERECTGHIEVELWPLQGVLQGV